MIEIANKKSFLIESMGYATLIAGVFLVIFKRDSPLLGAIVLLLAVSIIESSRKQKTKISSNIDHLPNPGPYRKVQSKLNLINKIMKILVVLFAILSVMYAFIEFAHHRFGVFLLLSASDFIIYIILKRHHDVLYSRAIMDGSENRDIA